MVCICPINISKKSQAFSWLGPLFLAISCTVLLSSCTSFNHGLGQASNPQDIHTLSDKAVLLKVPFVSQKTPEQCGLASVEMLTRYYGVPLNDAQRQSLTDEAAKNQGISGATLKRTLEQAGYFVAVFPGTLDREPTGIYRHLDGNRPLIVMLRAKDGTSGHYVILNGYDPERNLVALLDPASGQMATPLDNFKSGWMLANQFTFLAIPSALQKK